MTLLCSVVARYDLRLLRRQMELESLPQWYSRSCTEESSAAATISALGAIRHASSHHSTSLIGMPWTILGF